MMGAAVAVIVLFAAGLVLLAVVFLRSRVAPGAGPAVEPEFDPRSPKRLLTRLTRELKARARGVDPRYDVPWIAILGPPDSGKSALAKAASPAGALAESSDGLDSFFFEGGVAIEVRGTVAFPANEGGLGLWRSTLARLRAERPRRPLDGVVVALPATLFVEEGAANRRETVASILRARLLELQTDLGFLLPVYVLITKADLIAGFPAFAASLPEAQHRNPLGWSSPYRPDLPFDPAWIDEAFAETYRALIHAQMELFGTPVVTAAPVPAVNRAFLFPSELARLRPAVRLFLERALRPSAYDPHPIFRGLYFAGEKPGREGGLLFARDLFEEKIFAERGLGVPLGAALTARNRQSRWAQAVAAALALTLGIGYWRESARLDVRASDHLRFLDSLRAAAVERGAAAGGDSSLRLDRGYRLAQSMSRLRSDGFRSPWIPASYAFPAEPEIARWFKTAFGFVLADFRDALEARGRRLSEQFGGSSAAVARASDSDSDDEDVREGLEGSPDYRQLRAFGASLARYVENVNAFNALAHPETGTLDDFSRLASYLVDESGYAPLQLPEEPYGAALRSATAEPVRCGGPSLQRSAAAVTASFRSGWLGESNPLEESVDGFLLAWTDLSRGRTARVPELKAALDELASRTKAFKWLGSPFAPRLYPVLAAAPFAPGPGQANPCELNLAGEIDGIRDSHNRLRLRLLERTDGGAGGLLNTVLDADLDEFTLSERTALMKRSLDEIATLGFLPAGEPPPRSGLTGAAWDGAQLDQALAAIDRFEQFRLPALPPAIEQKIRAGVREHLAEHVWAAVRPGGGMPDAAEPEHGLVTVADRIRRAGPLLRQSAAGRRIYGLAVEEAQRIFLAFGIEASRRYQDLMESGGEPAARGASLTARAVDQWYSIRQQPDALARWGEFVERERDSLVAAAHANAPLVALIASARPNAPGLKRWREFLADVERYDAKAPLNGVTALDTALRTEIPAIAPEKNCLDNSAVTTLRGPLTDLRARLLRAAVARCLELAAGDRAPRYARIARAFDLLLKQKFPYAAPGENPLGDARLTDLKAFYSVYATQAGAALAGELTAEGCAAANADFLRHFDLIRPLYAPAFEQGLAAPAADVTAEFRVERASELAGSHVADWAFGVGAEEVRLGEPARALRWIGGSPVKFRFRLAKDSPLQPRLAAGPPLAAKQVEFLYAGPWSLLAALESQRAPGAELAALRDAEPYTLRFSIPVEGEASIPEVRIYVRLRVAAAGKKEEIRVPAFPSAAPAWKDCRGSS